MPEGPPIKALIRPKPRPRVAAFGSPPPRPQPQAARAGTFPYTPPPWAPLAAPASAPVGFPPTERPSYKSQSQSCLASTATELLLLTPPHV